MRQFVIHGRKLHRLSMVLPLFGGTRYHRDQGPNVTELRDAFRRNDLIAHFGRLRNEFHLVSRKIEALSQLTCLQRPAFTQLDRLATETLQLSRRIQRELQQGSEPQTRSVPDPAWIDELIEQCSDYQDRLQRQLALVAQLREDAVELRDELNLLAMRGRERTGSLSFDGIKGLARRIVSELVCDVTPPVLHPRLALDVLSELLGNRADSEILAVAFASAQSVARAARVTWLREDQVELVTAAALLQDCGKLLTPQFDAACDLIPNSATPDHHALIGATIISGYRDAPAGLSSLIAQHHDRLHKSGDSSRHGPNHLSDFSKLLAVASRLERLRLRFAFDSDLLTPPDQAESPAMVQLWNEALNGDWDLNLTRKLLIQRDASESLQNFLDQTADRRFESASSGLANDWQRMAQPKFHRPKMRAPIAS